MFGGGLVMLMVWLVPIVLVIWLASSWVRRSRPDPVGKNALDILKERYSRGEIGQDEFEQKRRDISDTSKQ